LRGQVNARQEKAVLRMLREGPEGFKGGLSAGNYPSITGASAATAPRDLADLVEKGGAAPRRRAAACAASHRYRDGEGVPGGH